MADPSRPLHGKVILVTVCLLASLLEVIDTTIVGIAAPSIMGELGIAIDQVSWVLTGYILANAIILPISGWCTMQLGRRNYFTACIALFTLSSFFAATAPNIGWLITFRIIQGLAGGGILPVAQVLIQECFPDKRKELASAIFAISVLVGAMAGPVLGGLITTYFSWRMIFLVNIPIGIIAIPMAWFFTTEMENGRKKPGRIDFAGLALLVIAIAGIQFVLERGERYGWFSSSTIVITLSVGIIALIAFIYWELYCKNPLLNLRMFKHNPVWAGPLAIAGAGFVLYSTIFAIPILVETVLNISPLQVGLLFVPGTACALFIAPITAFALKKTHHLFIFLIGTICLGLVCWMFAHITSLSSYDSFFLPLILRSVGLTIIFISVTTLVFKQFEGEALAHVSGIGNLARQIGGSFGIAIFSALYQRNQKIFYSYTTGDLTLLRDNVRETYQGIKAAVNVSADLLTSPVDIANNTFHQMITQQALILGSNRIFAIWILVVFGSILLPLFLLRIRKGPPISRFL
ncbi:DHA2 family efflux MFS transporter permease subunit [Simkania negevensis]|uniref:DHA2 family efflux MFS transporter permease subunit n=1 Tax=Simkania negevensis TaxID=83561 RepID=A0ABS3AQH1_9BACT|nr:DHA2 family efflux MFS transporter permease subunit [Simkania negevensis]